MTVARSVVIQQRPTAAAGTMLTGSANALSLAAEQPADFNAVKRQELQSQIDLMEQTDMAVIVSQQQNEIDLFKEKGLDIEPHRVRMVKEDMETKFKNPDDPFRLVFVCAMWLTGFDSPLLVDAKVNDSIDDAVEKTIVNDELKKQFISLANRVVRLFKAILPDASANEFAPIKTCLAVLAEKIRNFTEEASIDDIMNQVGELLDESIATKGYVIHATEQTDLLDLSQIDFDALKAHFEKGRKRTEAEKLKRAIGAKLQDMVTLNKSRTDLMEKFKKLIDEYNKGLNVEGFFAKLVTFVKELSVEEQRGVSEKLTEEELALFDILTKPEIDMTDGEKESVKKVARMLLQTLKEAKLVLDWRKKQRTRADVYATVKTVLDELPRAYTTELYDQKCDTVYQHVYDSYQGEGQSIYAGSLLDPAKL